ncbi:MAG: AAA family ATPase [Chloroflexi bacterium]|nr:AAA family ATPase [Chloroflexota bacterium]
MIHLKSLRVEKSGVAWPGHFPYNVPVIRTLDRLDFSTPVTFFVGENGSGKSALLESLACAIGSITAGSESVKTDRTLAPARELALHFRLAWSRRTHKGLFLRAEDFFGYVKHLAQMRTELEQDLKAADEEYKTHSEMAREYARMPYSNELSALQGRYGRGLEAYSHGESFLEFFQARFVADGLYLLDEPEAPLSPKRQLTFLSLLHRMLEQNAQFIIATHSPLIMAYPGAAIYRFHEGCIETVDYSELEHVWLTKSFLNNPERWLHELFSQDTEE